MCKRDGFQIRPRLSEKWHIACPPAYGMPGQALQAVSRGVCRQRNKGCKSSIIIVASGDTIIILITTFAGTLADNVTTYEQGTMRHLLIASLVCFSVLSSAGEIKYAHVEYEGNDYRLDLTMQVEAGQQGILALLMDHENFHELSDVMIESGLVQDAPEDKTRRRIVVETCIVFFCFKVVMVEDLEQFSDGRILAIMVPEESDFKYGRTEWQIEPLGPSRSEFKYRFQLQPDFWVPPAIGPFILKRKMVSEAQDSILRMESLAAGAHSEEM